MLDKAISMRTDIQDKCLLRGFSYVGGRWVGAADGSAFTVTDPATGATLGQVASLSGEEAAQAVDAAQQAFAGWAGRLPQERAQVLRRWFELITGAREDLTRKAAAALAAGCTVVAHPSAETPFSALALAELAERAGMPAGVFNVVTGDAPTVVAPWTADARVRAVSFTGSTAVGRLLYRQSADTMKRLVMELGGHAPVIVFEDADIDRAVNEAIKAKFATSGQDCLGANRIYVSCAIYDDFCRRFTAATRALRVGPGMDDPDIGPLMNAAAVAKQQMHVADAVANGATVACGGQVLPLGPLFYAPTVLTGVDDRAQIMREETFGPVAAITPFDTEAEVLARANATDYGLIAYLHTSDPRRIYRLSRSLNFGMVAVNRTRITGAPIPFGGTKQSGLGREGARRGMEEFMDIKYVCRDWD